MQPRTRHSLKALLHPFVFVLKEGGEIQKDFLDYSLMILHTHSLERIDSPASMTLAQKANAIKNRTPCEGESPF